MACVLDGCACSEALPRPRLRLLAALPALNALLLLLLLLLLLKLLLLKLLLLLSLQSCCPSLQLLPIAPPSLVLL
jgi:hypothetical protein